MSSGKTSQASDSRLAKERTETYTTSTSQSQSKTILGGGRLLSYTRVSKSSRGAFDQRDDITLRHYDEARDTFTALEVGYKKLLLEIESMKEQHQLKVSAGISLISLDKVRGDLRNWFCSLSC